MIWLWGMLPGVSAICMNVIIRFFLNGDVPTCSECEKQCVKDKERVNPVDDKEMKEKSWVAG